MQTNEILERSASGNGDEFFLGSRAPFERMALAGRAFGVSVVSGALANGGSIRVLLDVVSGAGRVHARFAPALAGGGVFELHEAPTVSVSGDALGVQNFRRDTNRQAVTLAFEKATVSASGTALEARALISGAAAPEHLAAQEWLLSEGVQYLATVRNDSGAAVVAGLRVDLYEPTGAPEVTL